MSDINEIAQKHAIDHQFLAIRLGASYGVLALGGLIATHLVMQGPFAALGALLAIVAALCAYLNFTIVSVAPDSQWIGRTQMLSIAAGVLSGLLILAGAL